MKILFHRFKIIQFLIITLIFFSGLLFAGIPTIQWRELHTPLTGEINIVQVNSPDDFWVFEISPGGKLAHFINQEWKEYRSPDLYKIENPRSQYCIIIDENTFLYSVIDEYYHTHFYIFRNNKWEKFPLICKAPVRNFLKISSSDCWIYGDWGNLYHFLNGKLAKIETPIKHHITSACKIDKNNIWIGVRQEGVFHYNEEKFIRIPVSDFSGDLLKLYYESDENFYALSADGRIFLYKNGQFNFYDSFDFTTSLINYDILNFQNWLAYSVAQENVVVFHRNKYITHQLPTGFHIIKAKYINNNSILCTGVNSIIIGNFQTKMFFEERGGKYYIDGSMYDNSIGAAFIDFNNDIYPEIFVLNYGEAHYNRLYQNIPGSAFLDNTSQSGLEKTSGSTLFAFNDYNKDGLLDGIFWNNETLLYFIKNNRETFLEDSQSHLRFEGLNQLMDINFVDYDKDNDDDLCFSFNYSVEREIGKNLLLKNSQFGRFRNADTDLSGISKGWNVKTCIADFNNDGFSDIYICDRWSRDNLLINNMGEFEDQIESRFTGRDTTKFTSNSAIAIDYDNDADLDIFLTHNDSRIMSIYNNNGEGFFNNVSDEFGFLNILDGVKFNYLCAADYNNDGFIDLFTSNNKGTKNYFFANDSGRNFIDITEESGLQILTVNGAISGDIDGDGDIDIFGVRNGVNLLWCNKLDNNDFLNVIVKGIKSSSDGRHSKIWVYEQDHLNDKNYLLGYREIGTDDPSPVLYNSKTAHFGLPGNKFYDVKVDFYSGKTRIVHNIAAGKTIVIAEYRGVVAFMIRLPAKFLLVLRHPVIYYYILSFLIMLIFIFGGVKIGTRYFEWSTRISLIVIIANISLFWIFANIFSQKIGVYKYFVPILANFFGIVIPLLSSFQFFFKSTKIIKSKVEDDLLKTILIFGHGEFATSNINSIQLLCENYPDNSLVSSEYMKQFEKRKTTFLNIVAPNIKKIIYLYENTNFKFNDPEKLQQNFKLFLNNLKKLKSGESFKNKLLFKEMLDAIKHIKNSIKQIRLQVFKQYTTDAIPAVVGVSDALKEVLYESGVELIRAKKDIANYLVLIKNFELADILDSCIRNSILAFDERLENRRVEVLIYRFPPNIHIDIIDNGKGIKKDNWEKIFQSGYSGSGGTGRGLHQAREVLNKYGGNIFVSKSKLGEGTTITIKMIEGVK